MGSSSLEASNLRTLADTTNLGRLQNECNVSLSEQLLERPDLHTDLHIDSSPEDESSNTADTNPPNNMDGKYFNLFILLNHIYVILMMIADIQVFQ